MYLSLQSSVTSAWSLCRRRSTPRQQDHLSHFHTRVHCAAFIVSCYINTHSYTPVLQLLLRTQVSMCLKSQ